MTAKKSSLKTLVTAILGGAFFCIALTGCENFLKGADIKKQLEESIEIANSSPVTFYVMPDEGSGTVNPTQLRLKKKESFDILFTPAESYLFQKWEVLDKTSGEVVEGIIQFKNETSLETSGLVLKTRENLVIHPKCVLQPAVTSHTPSSATEIQLAHTPIVINFNMPMDYDNLINNIVISSLTSAELLNDYFTPVLSPDGYTLTLIPENPAFVNLIDANTMDVTVSLSDKICVTIDEQEYSLIQNSNSNFSVRYKPVVEKVRPEKNTFFITRTPITLENAESLSSGAKMSPDFDASNNYGLTAEQKQAFLVNTTASKIYIYGSYFDEDSGVKTITVTEGDKDTSIYMVGYDYGDIATFYTENGVTKFCIKYDVQSINGKVDITTVVYDAASNPAKDEEKIEIVKVSPDSFLNVDVYGGGYPLITNVSSPRYFNPWEIETDSDLEGLYLPDRKTLRVGFWQDSEFYYPIRETIFGNFARGENDLTAYCHYKDKNGVLQTSPMNKGNVYTGQFYLELDVNSVDGLEGTIIVTDELLNNSTTLDFKFPSAPDIVYYKFGENEEQTLIPQSLDGYEYYLDARDKSNGETQLFSLITPLDDNFEYKLLPYNNNYNQKKNAYLMLNGEIGSESYTKSSSTTLPSGTKVQLDSTTPYSTSKGEIGKTNITINLAQDSWDSFDGIYVDYYNEDSVNYPKNFVFVPGEMSLTITEDTKNLYSKNYFVDAYGVKNNLKTTVAAQTTISKFTDSSHDNVLPTAYLERPAFDHYTFNMEDVGSSPKSAYLLLKSGEKLTVIEPGATEFEDIEIPVKTIEELAKCDIDDFEDSYHRSYRCYAYYFEIQDTAGNSCIAKVQGKPVEKNEGVSSVSKPSGSTSKTWKFTFKRQEKYIYIKQIYRSYGNEWTWAPNIVQDKEQTFSYQQSDVTYNDIEDGVFVKIVTANMNIGKVYHYSNPQYFYTGTQNSGTFDYMLDYSPSEMLIASDAPVLVETVATKKSFEECKALSKDDWVPDNKEFRSYEETKNVYTVLPLNASVIGPAKYTIPLNKMDRLAAFDGYNCYVVIAHLANGETIMSEVRQR